MIVLFLLFEAVTSSQTRGSKRRLISCNESKEDGKEEGENSESGLVPKRRAITSDNCQEGSVQKYVEPTREEALKIFVGANLKKIDELIENNYNVFETGIWDELIAMKNYIATKYMLTNHFQSITFHRKTFVKAITTGSTALVTFLLNLSPDSLAADGSKAISAALKHRRYSILKILGKARFDGNVIIATKKQRCPLHEAVIMNEIQLVKHLLKFNGIKVNIPDRNGNIPLHFCKSIEIAKLLLANGANLVISNIESLFPIDFVAKQSNHELVMYFEPDLVKRFGYFVGACRPVGPFKISRKLVIDRQNVLEDSFFLASRETNWYKSKSNFVINFIGETGIDQGGLWREWMSLLIERFFVPRLREESETGSSSSSSTGNFDITTISDSANEEFDYMDDDYHDWARNHQIDDDSDDESQSVSDMFFEPVPSVSSSSSTGGNRVQSYFSIVPRESKETYYNAPFECVDTDNKMYKISTKFTGPVEVYKFIGSVVAKGLLKKIPLKVRLVPSLLRIALNRGLSFEDLLDDDPSMYKGMLYVLEDDFDFDEAEYTLPSNEHIKVTKANVRQFLDETAIDSMYQRQKASIDKFVEGFRSILNYRKVSGYFSIHDLQNLLLGASDELNREQLKNAIKISGASWRTKSEIFWTGLDSLIDEEIIQVIRFITGINGLPYGGVGNLGKLIQIYDGRDEMFPRASTCTYSMNLPIRYSTSEEVAEGLRLAIASSPEFIDGGCC